MRIAKIFIAVFLVLLLAGCAETSYVRSSAFIDADLIKSIYIMPIAEEITIDSDLKTPADKLQTQLKEARQLAKDIIREQFEKRGYLVSGYSKDFSNLDKNDPQDELIRQAIFEFLTPSKIKPAASDQDKEEKDIIRLFLESSATQIDEQSLVDKTIACFAIFPQDTDTVMFIKIRSHIAKKTFWNSNKEDNTLRISIKMLSLSKKEPVLSYSRSYESQNILDKKQLESALKDILKNIPVKL